MYKDCQGCCSWTPAAVVMLWSFKLACHVGLVKQAARPCLSRVRHCSVISTHVCLLPNTFSVRCQLGHKLQQRPWLCQGCKSCSAPTHLLLPASLLLANAATNLAILCYLVVSAVQAYPESAWSRQCELLHPTESALPSAGGQGRGVSIRIVDINPN